MIPYFLILDTTFGTIIGICDDTNGCNSLSSYILDFKDSKKTPNFLRLGYQMLQLLLIIIYYSFSLLFPGYTKFMQYGLILGLIYNLYELFYYEILKKYNWSKYISAIIYWIMTLLFTCYTLYIIWKFGIKSDNIENFKSIKYLIKDIV